MAAVAYFAMLAALAAAGIGARFALRRIFHLPTD